ncbi:MAG TPA: hypothetical protein VL346_04295 [Acidobacteriaceae bacterium]|nr:hypothetical protein [Acidobacteriaceae bacterium]
MARNARRWRIAAVTAFISLCAFSLTLHAQEPSIPAPSTPSAAQTPAIPDATVQTAAQASGIAVPAPLAIVPVEGVQLSGAMQVADGKATIGSSGSITAGEKTAIVTLPGRGQIKLCATTRMSLSADKSIAASLGPNETPGLMMALDRGAMETSFDTGRNSDVILTPDFRITISGPGRSSVQVRLGEKGDTCVDNRGPNAPYVTVSGIFEGGFYRVQDGQRVLFEHGSLHEVVDREKESCGCPEEPVPTVVAHASSNPFPVAQSAGLAPMKTPPPSVEKPGVQSAQATATLRYNGGEPKASVTTAEPQTPVVAGKPAKKNENQKGFLGRLGHFFRTLFGG